MGTKRFIVEIGSGDGFHPNELDTLFGKGGMTRSIEIVGIL
jgi:hypothetical protein